MRKFSIKKHNKSDAVVADENVVEKTDREKKLDEIKTKVRTFVITYRFIIIGLVSMLILLAIGRIITSKERSMISLRHSEIYAYDAEYQVLMRTPKDTLRASKPFTLDASRWKKDDDYVLNLIRDAFEHNSVADYEAHRAKYANLSYNLTDLQKEYFSGKKGPVYAAEAGSKTYLGDASELLESKIDEFNSYVVSVDGDKYTYIAMMTITQNVYDGEKYITQVTNNILLTYTCDNPVNTDINHSVDVIDLTANWVYDAKQM